MSDLSHITIGGAEYNITASTLDTTGQSNGVVPKADGIGGISWNASGAGVLQLGGADGAIGINTNTMEIDTTNNTQTLSCYGMPYTTTPPTEGGSDKVVKYAFLTRDQISASSFSYQPGWLYYIIEDNSSE